jgi:hypothetical protein
VTPLPPPQNTFSTAITSPVAARTKIDASDIHPDIHPNIAANLPETPDALIRESIASTPRTPLTGLAAEVAPSPLDELMERASLAILKADYFAAEDFALRALSRALRLRDFERMARIVLPLQEARRQRRHEAVDAGYIATLSELPARGTTFQPGCYLLQPPLIGRDAATIRDFFNNRKLPTLILCKEPTTSKGLWPIVAVNNSELLIQSVRVQVEPPPNNTPTPAWFMQTQEALGNAAMAKVKPSWPADHRVEDVLEWLEAIPDHEKLAQLLESTCREAMLAPASSTDRRRGMFDDNFSF